VLDFPIENTATGEVLTARILNKIPTVTKLPETNNTRDIVKYVNLLDLKYNNFTIILYIFSGIEKAVKENPRVKIWRKVLKRDVEEWKACINNPDSTCPHCHVPRNYNVYKMN